MQPEEQRANARDSLLFRSPQRLALVDGEKTILHFKGGQIMKMDDQPFNNDEYDFDHDVFEESETIWESAEDECPYQ